MIGTSSAEDRRGVRRPDQQLNVSTAQPANESGIPYDRNQPG
jgi:hypothetical protein